MVRVDDCMSLQWYKFEWYEFAVVQVRMVRVCSGTSLQILV